MDFAAGVLFVWGSLPSYDPILPPLHTVYTCIHYTYSHREGGRGGRANQGEG
jgi:hypothetical protein